jgi:hypothetical protein
MPPRVQLIATLENFADADKGCDRCAGSLEAIVDARTA